VTEALFDRDTSRRVEALYESPDAIRRRGWVLALAELRPGERVLDVGCGPGFLASEMGAAVGSAGRVDAIDNSPPMLELARARCAGQSWVTLHHADAERLDFADSEFDAVVAVQVHEYVPDVEAAIRELQRVLRPGGRALVVATDWDSIVWSSGDRGRMSRVLSAWEEHLAHPHLPCHLGSLLDKTGLALRRCEVFVQLNPVFDARTYSYGLLDLIHRFVPGRRGVTREEADSWAGELRGRGEAGEYFFSLNQYLFLATKP
jgi:SAM-dependent methyltransferase